jgi:hypothetical protein
MVACPDTAACSCGEATVCCAVYDEDQQVITSSACSELASCADVAFACDGPEDCESGETCCARGLGAQCVDEGTCSGVDSYVLCRSDDDCGGLDTCTPAEEGTFYEDLIGFCQ